MVIVGILFLLFLTYPYESFGLNVLMISLGAAGHIIPMFELAKAMKNHNVTFLTDSYSHSYITFESYPNLSSFRLIYPNDSADALIDQTRKMQDVVAHMINHSLIDSLPYMTPRISQSIHAIMNKTVHTLMQERFDVIIGTVMTVGLHALCKDANASCVILIAEKTLNMFDVNLPNSYSLLSSQQLMKFQYRIYNVAFTLRLITSTFTKLINFVYTIFRSLPQVPGPFYETFTLKNILFTKCKCLKLISLPPTLYPPSHSDHSSKYLGAFIDESLINYIENNLTRWIKSKHANSIVYVAFGSVSIVEVNRMKNLINGLAQFLFQTDNVSLLLAFRNANYDNFQIVLNEIENDNYRRILLDNQRVRIENEFLQQKWILKQNSINIFLSHCGMGSTVEGLYFQKPILCLPLCIDQFTNAIAIEYSGVGLSLFQPPSTLKSFQNPIHFHDYTFSPDNVVTKLSTMWRNISYGKAVRMMSLEMKHAGGVRRAVDEIEFLATLNGHLDRYAPFQSILPFYQQYMLDLIFFYIILPITIIFYLFVKCYKQNRKEKVD